MAIIKYLFNTFILFPFYFKETYSVIKVILSKYICNNNIFCLTNSYYYES